MNAAGIARVAPKLYALDLIRRFSDLVRSLAPTLTYEQVVEVIVSAGREALDSDRDVEAVIELRLKQS